MISMTIGRTFLTAFNKKYNKSYTSKQFFETVFFELFFNHPKYMLWQTNSPFVQMKKGQKPHLLREEDRIEKLNNLAEKITTGDRDASIAIGFPASETNEFATTSGLVSDIDIPADEFGIYDSWIGAGLGIGVSGGYCIFFNDPEILLTLYDGWQVYRGFLNDNSIDKLAPNKINTWNGQWLNYYHGKKFRKGFDFGVLDNMKMFSHDKQGNILINTVKWSQLFFNLSSKFPDQTLMGYLYSLGQTNKTIGFIPFYFQQARRIKDFYEILFGKNNAIKDSRAYEEMFGIHIKRACELGAIGLHALQPKDLKTYFGQGKIPNFKKTAIPVLKKGESEEDFQTRKQKASNKEYEKVILFRTYKTWLVAMLTKNKEDMLDYTEKIARALHEYREDGRKTDRKNLIEKELLIAASRKKFIDALAVVVKDVQSEYLEIIRELKKRVHLMTSEDFAYFVVLLRFDYAYEERNI
ncbi:hypothetical protein [Desulfobacula phenolica]|uniref:Uncharacterized protein n=1 Tax=Desulfobacula phenolica TaxID=90732 RepID=A0A1H2FGK7_9BACT|nr:hypothetical protein [Desulfobacula phenolica]SDU06403.1 hypothetical protein SAMN04487931_104142 [Desulfobacula phenolica]